MSEIWLPVYVSGIGGLYRVVVNRVIVWSLGWLGLWRSLGLRRWLGLLLIILGKALSSEKQEGQSEINWWDE